MKEFEKKIEGLMAFVAALEKEGIIDTAEAHTFYRRLERLNVFIQSGISTIMINTEVSLVCESLKALAGADFKAAYELAA